MELEQKILSKVYYKSLLPNMIAILGGTINVLFDGILVGRRLGEIGIASVNQSLAVYLLLCTIGSMIAAGASAESASAIGGNCMNKSQEFFSLALEAAVILGIIISIAGCLVSGMLAEFLGSQDSKGLVYTYIWITFAGGIFKILLYIPFFYLRLDGKTKQSAIAMLVMTVINIVLDYVFLFTYDWGIAGAAFASVIASAVACVMSFVFLFGKNGSFHFKFVAPKKELLARIVSSGSPIASNNLFSAVRIICLNLIMNQVGGSELVAIFAITNSVNEFSICIQNGIPQSASALLGISYGEKDRVSVKKLLRLQVITGFVFSVIFAIVLSIGSSYIGSLFGSHQNVNIAIICLAISIVIGTCNSVMTYYYYATMDSKMANLITVLRVFVFTVLAAWLLKPVKEWIWLFYIIGELTTMCCWLMAVRLRKKSELEEEKCIQFSVNCDTEAICEASEKIQEFCENSGFTMEQAMKISLALEELLIITADKSMDNQGNMEVRILKTETEGILRIRSEGKRYNPLEFAEDSLDFLGVKMIMKMAKRTEYQSTLGLNTLIVFV